MAAIELDGISKRYGTTWAVQGVTLQVAEGETLALVGPSGCGKSTTLKCINRLVEPDEGRVRIGGRDVRTLDAATLRRSIGYVIQDVGLFPHYTVRRNVAVVPTLLGWSRARVRERVDALLDAVGLDPREYGERYPLELSGGQRQRVGIARALAADPPVVLLDEPFSALDPVARERLQCEFASLSRRMGKTFVLVTHDIIEAVRLGTRLAVMRDGCLVQQGPPREVVARPADDGVAALLGRRRYELRLMTTRVGDVLDKLAPTHELPDASVVTVACSDSLWDALDRLESSGARWVRVESAEGCAPSLASREDLLRAAGASP